MANCGNIYRDDSDSNCDGGVMTDLFKPEDFAFMTGRQVCYMNGKEISDKANRILHDRLLSKAVRVYHTPHSVIEWTLKQHKDDVETALLIDIKPIEKPKCVEHFPIAEDWIVRDRVWSGTCEKCGVKLKATWNEAE